MLDIVIFSSDSFMPRTRVCIASCEKHIPNSKIHLVKLNNQVTGDYVSGLAKARLEYTKKLLEEGSTEVMVLGADCVFYSTPTEFLNNRAAVVLVPHVINPPKTNGAGLYKTGHVNADMMLFRPASLSILDWLVEQEMKDDSSNGVFYEQTWLSALPFISRDVSICRDPAINYAYFNFNERKLTRGGVRFYVNGRPLVMVQFSGYYEGWPAGISKHHNGGNNGYVTPTILELFQEYELEISK